MVRTSDGFARQPRISIDVEPELATHLRRAATEHDGTVSQYVRDAIKARLGRVGAVEEADAGSLTAASDPVLAELGDNAHDAAYDRL